jgi:hypothetical protein
MPILGCVEADALDPGLAVRDHLDHPLAIVGLGSARDDVLGQGNAVGPGSRWSPTAAG